MTRWVFKAKLGDLRYSESRTGIFGNLKRFLEAIDVAINDSNSYQQRKESINRAYKNLKKVEEVTTNQADRKLLCKYTHREVEKLQAIRFPDNSSRKDQEYIGDFNHLVELTKAICDKICGNIVH